MLTRNIKLFTVHYFLWSFSPFSIIAILYFQQLTGSYALAMSVFAVSSLASALLEIPMGMVSDLIGRKFTMISGACANIVRIISYIAAGYYTDYALPLLYLGAFFQGFCFAQFSGTDEAILYESIKADGKADSFGHYFGRARSWAQIAMGISALLGGTIAYYTSYLLVTEIMLVFPVLLLICNLFWAEPPKELSAEDKVFLSPLAHLKKSLGIFRQKPKLLYLAGTEIVGKGIDMSPHQFEIAYYGLLVPTYLLGIIRIFKQAIAAVSFWFSGKIIQKYKPLRVLIRSEYGLLLTHGAALALNNFFTPFVIAGSNVFYGVNITAQRDLLQKEYTSSQRATLSSIISMAASVVYAGFSVLIGYLADLTSARTALLCFVLLRFIKIVIYIHLARHKIRKV